MAQKTEDDVMMKAERFEDNRLRALKMKKGTLEDGERSHKPNNSFVEAGEGNKANSLAPLEGAQAWQHPSFSPVKLILDSWPPELSENKPPNL